MLPDMHRPDTCRGTGVKQITHLQGEEVADIRNDPIYAEDHVGRIALLDRLPIDIKAE